MEKYMLCRSGSGYVRRKSNRNYLALCRIVTGLKCVAMSAATIFGLFALAIICN